MARCQFVFYTALRPAVIVQVKIKYIDLENKTIFLPGTITKNRQNSIINMPVPLVDELRKSGVLNNEPEYYLFSRNLRLAIFKYSLQGWLNDLEREQIE